MILCDSEGRVWEGGKLREAAKRGESRQPVTPSQDNTKSELARRLHLLFAAMAVLLGCGPKVDSATQLRLEQAALAGDTAGVRAALDAGATFPSLS